MTFNADVSDGMNWRFVPTQRAVKVSCEAAPPYLQYLVSLVFPGSGDYVSLPVNTHRSK